MRCPRRRRSSGLLQLLNRQLATQRRTIGELIRQQEQDTAVRADQALRLRRLERQLHDVDARTAHNEAMVDQLLTAPADLAGTPIGTGDSSSRAAPVARPGPSCPCVVSAAVTMWCAVPCAAASREGRDV